ncbi:MAG: hypothetical protein ACYDCL_10840 [Myxococcales bacterium]
MTTRTSSSRRGARPSSTATTSTRTAGHAGRPSWARSVGGAALLALGLCGANCGGGGGVQPAFTPTYTNVNTKLFQVSCAISPCHVQPLSPSTNGNLDLKTDAYAALLGDGGGVPAVDIGEPYNYHYQGMLLVKPGDPANSLLFQVIAEGNAAPLACVQDAGFCQYGQHMPNVAQEALGPTYVEAVREWIANGAQND